ncbi:E3 ubiquitin-protein ligase TRIM58 isoform X2 [Dromiciops gliroides]|uniref:E3 ubiquitin-protein ligase TRIM58 isoform X2 n=1 Tax=Dromiciops gliroides TaxID=33562 RepID=UPI001CC5F740|nr:E3 ubiquitin-protein ligase TRIM58 isoform X2 [Dromiciops gliroides]
MLGKAVAMATGFPVERLKEEAKCPICLDFLQDPVSVDCGHSFCLPCITEFCEKSNSSQGSVYSCPQCRSQFYQKSFRPNRQLASMVESIKQLGLSSSTKKTWLCEIHKEELNYFCEEDQIPLCWICDTSPEHRTHKTIPLEEATRSYKEKVELWKQRFMLEFQKQHGFLAQEEQKQLRRLEEEERVIIQKLKDSKAKLVQQSRTLRDLTLELEECSQCIAWDLQEHVKDVLRRSENIKFQEPELISIDLKTMCCVPGMMMMLKMFQGIVGIMDGTNESIQDSFLLLGFSNRPQLEAVLFVIILIAYLLTVVGNTTIILLSQIDSRLHTPMYFFLTHLSFLDLCFTTSSIPQLLYNLSGPDKTISYTGCAIQLFLFLALGGVECLLLAVMAYDRFVAVCKPLHYMVIMHPKLCLGLVSIAWFGGVANSLTMSPITLKLPRCGHRKVDHFLCEMPALIRLACINTVVIEGTVFVLAVIIVLTPLVLILVSYGYITQAVLQIRSAVGRWKAINTCSSHLIVVSLFYGNIIYMYMQPGNSASQDQGKFLTLFYNIVTPLLNPLIYTLRNKEVKGALRRLLRENKGTRKK